MKKYYYYLLLTTVLLSAVFAGCGSCEIKNEDPIDKRSSAFLTSIPKSVNIEGLVIASCNKCNLGKKSNRKCSMGIKIGNKVLALENDVHDHKSAHSTDGICNALRIAYIDGKVTKNQVKASVFELIDSPK